MFFILLICFVSCSGEKFEISGKYESVNNDMYYGIEINEELKLISFYMLSHFSSNMDKTEIEELKNWKISIRGKFAVKQDKFIVTNIESDVLPTERTDRLEIQLKDNTLEIRCNNLHNEIFGSHPRLFKIKDNDPCLEGNIIYQKK